MDDLTGCRVLVDSRAGLHEDVVAVIYGLVHPAEPGRVRYVGHSTSPWKRYLTHTSGSGVWPVEWRADGHWPLMIELEAVRRSDAPFPGLVGAFIRRREVFWTETLKRRGQADFNRIGTDHQSFVRLLGMAAI